MKYFIDGKLPTLISGFRLTMFLVTGCWMNFFRTRVLKLTYNVLLLTLYNKFQIKTWTLSLISLGSLQQISYCGIHFLFIWGHVSFFQVNLLLCLLMAIKVGLQSRKKHLWNCRYIIYYTIYYHGTDKIIAISKKKNTECINNTFFLLHLQRTYFNTHSAILMKKKNNNVYKKKIKCLKICLEL